MTRTAMAKLLRLARDGRVGPLGIDVRALGFASFAQLSAASAKDMADQDRRVQEVLTMLARLPKRATRIPPRQRRGV